MKYKLEIKSYLGSVLYVYESDTEPTIKEAVERANLSRAKLSRANLSGADLYGANLSRADLSGANLSGADLSGANLSGADLYGANLSRAKLSRANLSGADLYGANLSRADLYGAKLSRADLSGANLSRAKEDFRSVLKIAINEVIGLYKSILDGKIDGSQYKGECACLVGTIANERKEDIDKLSIDLKPDSDRLSERLFLAIKKGDTPESNPISAIVKDWMEEFMKENSIQIPKRVVVWE